jgi:hypothetical protein
MPSNREKAAENKEKLRRVKREPGKEAGAPRGCRELQRSGALGDGPDRPASPTGKGNEHTVFDILVNTSFTTSYKDC